ncbi:3'-5' exonuclease [Hymenobacter aerilatus]|uniref:3'-5' exonuclease n=1 Tax=Hymenobacter aerilatus TaxID=2932251 RepID=A0A8T9SU28_9BACT|nr:3'-5' exonuclease [Hymenobacter aerilatus]UOR03720.1 3'-5' exonuclease [Hymenobacter aerilatus]
MAADFLLFVDTETTGLPTRWDRPYAEEGHWPHVAQLAWQVYTAAGELVCSDAGYLRVPAGTMPAEAVAVHGLTEDFLHAHGGAPRPVLERLHHDLLHYRPQVIGHFLQLDFHVLGAAFQRVGLSNPLPALPQFCTMFSSRPLSLRGHYLKLADLHEYLFQEPLPRLHDAESDAAATARCFFEMRRRGLFATTAPTLPRLVPPAPRSFWAQHQLPITVGAALFFLLLYWLIYG